MENVQEEWRPVKECSYYEISRCGIVLSLPRTVMRKNGSPYKTKRRILTPAKTRTGYLFVSLYGENGDKQHYIHSLVASAFIGPRPAGMEINHKDGNKQNNSLDNLEYVSRQQNMRHAHETGLVNSIGECNPMSKYLPDQIRLAHSLVSAGLPHKIASRRSGVDVGTIESVCRGKNWKYLGLPVVRRT